MEGMRITFPADHTLSVTLSDKTSFNIAAFNKGNCKNGCQTTDYLLKGSQTLQGLLAVPYIFHILALK